MSVALGAIADDLTGASDLATVLSRSGRPVVVRFGVPEEPPADAAPFEILALKIRTAPEDVRRAQAALGTAQSSALVEAALRLGVRRFIVAGGETSGAIVQVLGITCLSIGPEIAPGVPWTFGASDGIPVALALKSGNFGTESFFEGAWAVLEGK